MQIYELQSFMCSRSIFNQSYDPQILAVSIPCIHERMEPGFPLPLCHVNDTKYSVKSPILEPEQ